MGQPSMADVPKGMKCMTLFQLQKREKQRAPVSVESNGEGDRLLVLSL